MHHTTETNIFLYDTTEQKNLEWQIYWRKVHQARLKLLMGILNKS
jgi:hypothetical protein